MSCDFLTLLWVQNSFLCSELTVETFFCKTKNFVFIFNLIHPLFIVSFSSFSFHASLATCVVSSQPPHNVRTTKTTFDIILELKGTSKTFFVVVSPSCVCYCLWNSSNSVRICAAFFMEESYKKVSASLPLCWINSHKFSTIEPVSVSSSPKIHST